MSVCGIIVRLALSLKWSRGPTKSSETLHTTLYGSAAGCRAIQKRVCSLKVWIDFQKHTKSINMFLQIKKNKKQKQRNIH